MSKKNKMASGARRTTWFHVLLITERVAYSTVMGAEGGSVRVKRAAVLKTAIEKQGLVCCDVKEYRLHPFRSRADAEASQASFDRMMAQQRLPDDVDASTPTCCH